MYCALSFSGNRVHVLLLVLVVERLQLGIGRIDLLLDVVEREHSVFELDLGVLLLSTCSVISLSLTVAGAPTAASSFCEAICAFTSCSNCGTLRLNWFWTNARIGLLPMKLPPGKKISPNLSLVQDSRGTRRR